MYGKESMSARAGPLWPILFLISSSTFRWTSWCLARHNMIHFKLVKVVSIPAPNKSPCAGYWKTFLAVPIRWYCKSKARSVCSAGACSIGYDMRLMIWRSWVRITAQYTFSQSFVVKTVLFVWKRPKINNQRLEMAHFFKRCSRMICSMTNSFPTKWKEWQSIIYLLIHNFDSENSRSK